MSPRSSSLVRGIAVLLVVLSTSACASLVKAALGKAGVEDNSKPAHGSTLSPALSSPPARPPKAAHTGTYEQMPVPSLWKISQGRPYSVAFNASRWTARGDCAPMPAGIADVLSVPEGAPATRLGSLGPFDINAWGVPTILFGGLLEHNGLDLTDQMFEHTARMMSQGQGCGYNVFVGITLGHASTVVVSR